MLDPVRFLSNRSSGLMGFEIAKAAARAGARVILVTGPTHLQVSDTWSGRKCPTPGVAGSVRHLRVMSAREMYRECLNHFPKTDIAIMTAAVSDYRPAKMARHKIKKCLDAGMTREKITLTLVRNPDILATLGRRKKRHQYLVGFALESRDLLKHAKDKLRRKNCDLIVANAVPALGSPRNTATLLFKTGRIQKLPSLTKAQLSRKILHHIIDIRPPDHRQK
jgi:phosphopantothenoylcysteine decarboxylase/phosphopantothenate--cysteine ligase